MKTKVTIEEVINENDSFPMSEMKPGQICVVQDGIQTGHLCIKSKGQEVWDVSDESYWHTPTDKTLVKQAPVGTKIIFEVV